MVTTLIIAVAMLTVWMLCYKKSYDNPRHRKRITMWLGKYFPNNPKMVYYFLVFIIYLGLPALFGWLLTKYANVPFADVFTISSTISPVYLIAVGFIGGVTMSIFATNLMLAISPKMDIPNNINKVTWIQETLVFPKRIVWIFPFLSAAAEEFFFRGACFFSLLAAGMPVIWAIAVVTVLFIANQVYLVDNAVQAAVIGAGSLFISIIGCLIVLITGSVLPSMIVHAVYAGFFVSSNDLF